MISTRLRAAGRTAVHENLVAAVLVFAKPECEDPRNAERALRKQASGLRALGQRLDDRLL